jgi:uncharacterized membrane protein YeaQ/YmgE (transglycosylase-associated protein family)
MVFSSWRSRDEYRGYIGLDRDRANSGGLGKLIRPGDDPGGIIVTILLGIAGAFVEGFLMQALFGAGSGGFIWSITVATIGAIILLAIYRLVVGRGAQDHLTKLVQWPGPPWFRPLYSSRVRVFGVPSSYLADWRVFQES